MTAMRTQISPTDAWPALVLDDWRETYASLQLRTQIVGKTRLALAPMQNHWWQVVLYVSARGLTTSPIPYGPRTFDIDFDFLDHRLVVRTNDGTERTMLLRSEPVAEFYEAYRELLRSLDIEARFWPAPNEMLEAIPFEKDRVHAAYDAEAAQRCWRALVQADRVLKEFRGRFLGKCSPVHFWWGGFDLACTRFSGRPAPPHPGGFPNLPDWVTREAYSHECISAGWWPGIPGGPVPEAAFYCYAYPEPDGCRESPVLPEAASYHPDLREWILPYDAVRRSADPDRMLLEFLESTYGAAARLGAWDRGALERPPGPKERT